MAYFIHNTSSNCFYLNIKTEPVSFASGFSSMMVMIVSAMDALYSKPPSSLSMAERKFMSTECLRGNFKHSARIALTTTILNSSLISLTKLEI